LTHLTSSRCLGAKQGLVAGIHVPWVRFQTGGGDLEAAHFVGLLIPLSESAPGHIVTAPSLTRKSHFCC